MTEKTELVERKYLQCDGCGYIIGKDRPHMILTVKQERQESIDFHFHLPAQPGEARSWGEKDCLGYWHANRAARQLSTRTDGTYIGEAPVDKK